MKTGDVEFYKIFDKKCNEKGNFVQIIWGMIVKNTTPFFIEENTISAWNGITTKRKNGKWEDIESSKVGRTKLPDNIK